MKFTEEKLEKAESMVNGQLLMVNEWNVRPQLHLTIIYSPLIMSS